MSLFQRTQGRITPGEIIFNNFYRGTSVTQQKKKPVLYQKLKFIGYSSEISIDHFQFRECTKLSFHSLLHEKKVTGCYVHHNSHLVQSFHVSQLVS